MVVKVYFRVSLNQKRLMSTSEIAAVMAAAISVARLLRRRSEAICAFRSASVATACHLSAHGAGRRDIGDDDHAGAGRGGRARQRDLRRDHRVDRDIEGVDVGRRGGL